MRIKSSYIWALVVAAVIGGWLYTGEIVVGGQPDEDGASGAPEENAEQADPLFRVRVDTFHAGVRIAHLDVRGRTQAKARVHLKAETPGLVEAMPVYRGDRVTKGDLVCQIENGARDAALLEAQALLEQARLDHDAAVRLEGKGYTAETRVRALRAQLDAAHAAVARAELDIARTQIRAPFDGVIEMDDAEIGDYLNLGTTCITLVALDPLLVVGQVSERDVAKLETGMEGNVKLVTGEELPGIINFISPSAEERTRTFRVELQVENPDYAIRDNITADINIELNPAKAHLFTPAILTLNDAGQIGVKAVSPDNIVNFVPVALLGDTNEGVWVAGLPDPVTLVTVGQEYVIDGQEIMPVPADADTSEALTQ